MYRFYCEESGKETVTLTGEDVNHIRSVLRMRCGERLIVCDGRGMDRVCRIERLDPQHVTVIVEEERPAESELPVRLTLYQGLPKKDKMEFIIQKAVELGVAQIVPVVTRRTVVKLEDRSREERKRERWQAIAVSAAKQSGRGILPEVSQAMSFAEALKRVSRQMPPLRETGKSEHVFDRTHLDQAQRSSGVLALLPYENARGVTALRDVLRTELYGVSGTSSDTVFGVRGEISVFIGPEGGFEESEVEAACEAGVQVVSLGRRILRTETAGLAALSILMYEIECAAEEGRN